MKERNSSSVVRLICCCAFFFFAVGVVEAQQLDIRNDSIQWLTDSLTDLNSDTTVANVCKFISYGTGSVDWVQDNGNYVIHWTVTDVTGDWSDIEGYGSVLYTLNQGELNGQLTLSRTPQRLAILLKVTGGTNNINVSYTVSSYGKI